MPVDRNITFYNLENVRESSELPKRAIRNNLPFFSIFGQNIRTFSIFESNLQHNGFIE
jgi:hypothetical protein